MKRSGLVPDFLLAAARKDLRDWVKNPTAETLVLPCQSWTQARKLLDAIRAELPETVQARLWKSGKIHGVAFTIVGKVIKNGQQS